MARVVETSGADVEQATVRALAQLGLSRDQVDVDVVREGKRGFLGIGGEDAVVRVTAHESLEAVAQQAAARQRGRRGGRGRGPDTRGAGMGGPAAPSRGPRPPRESHEAGAGAPAAGGRPGERREGRFDGRPDRRPDWRSRGPREPRPPTHAGGAGTPVPGAPDELPVAPITDFEDQVDLAGRTLRDLLALLGLTNTEITARAPETAGDGLGLVEQVFDIYGNDEDTSEQLGLLIGRRGETLGALQYLLNVIGSSQSGGDQIFGVDIEGYRRRREQSLIELALRIADEVRTSGDVITLEPMPASERRIIHLTLEHADGVRTESVGSGNDRQVEVMPDH
ncbi:MAG: protein jag [Dehalococcoidia bacterium]|nr:protein jag [Dehalococcoidia bacterium]